MGRSLSFRYSASRVHPQLDGDGVVRRAVASRRRSKPWFIIDPRHSRTIAWWDMATTLSLVFTALITPYEVAVVRRHTPRTRGGGACRDPRARSHTDAAVTPLRVRIAPSQLDPPTSWAGALVDPLFLINRLIDTIFFSDMGLQCAMPSCPRVPRPGCRQAVARVAAARQSQSNARSVRSHGPCVTLHAAGLSS
jgi:hypothetical protein